MEAVARAALDLATALAREDDGRPEFPEKSCDLLRGLAGMYEATDRRPEAEKARRQELSLREALARDHPSAERAVDVAGCRCNLGNRLAPDRPVEALALYDRAEADLTAALTADPGAEKAGQFLRITLASRAALHQRRKQFPAAVADRVRVVEMLEAIVKAQPSPDRRADLASGLERLARAYRAAG